MESRNCTVCKAEKPYSEFYRSKKGKNGYNAQCKICWAKKNREWERKNPELTRAKHKRWQDKNPERVRSNQRKYYERNKEKILSKMRESRKKNDYAITKKYRQKNRHKIDCHNFVALAVKLGYINRPTKCDRCEVHCKPHGHHDDYDKPLEVVWLCRKCHGKEHRMDSSA